MLFRPQGIQIVITPLNLLCSQNSSELRRLGINTIALCRKTATPKNIEVEVTQYSSRNISQNISYPQDIELLKYRIIIVNPEVAFKVGGSFKPWIPRARLRTNRHQVKQVKLVRVSETTIFRSMLSKARLGRPNGDGLQRLPPGLHYLHVFGASRSIELRATLPPHVTKHYWRLYMI